MPLSGLRSVSRDKIVEYLLNEAHPKGAPKAKFFMHFGFHPERPAELEGALLRHAGENEVIAVIDTGDGSKAVVVGPIVSPDGRNPHVRSVWFRSQGSTAHRFVTAYPE